MNNELLFGAIFFILGLIPAYYFYKKSIWIKEPVYSIKSNNIVSGSISKFENLKVLYKDREIENLTISKILFFNRGNETITSNDLKTINPIKFGSETSRVLDASLIQVNNHSNNIKVDFNKDTEYIDIDFDYLDHNQGFVVQVIHTGTSSVDLDLEGAIIGVQKPIRLDPKEFTRKENITRDNRVYSVLFSIAIIFWLVVSQTSIFPNQSDNQTIRLLLVLFGMIGGIATIASMFGLLFFILSKFWKINSIPQGLEKFFE